MCVLSDFGKRCTGDVDKSGVRGYNVRQGATMEPKQYLSTWMYEDVRWWQVVHQGSAVCGATVDKEHMVRLFKRKYPDVDMPVWNGDIGKFVALEDIA